MLASVSPASYRAMISGQSDWGIFPLLLDFSIIKDLGAARSLLVLQQPARLGMKSVRSRIAPEVSKSGEMIVGRRHRPASRQDRSGCVVTSLRLPGENSDKTDNSEGV